MNQDTSKELLAWVASVIQREQKRGTSGALKIEFQGGVVQRVRVESVEKPPKVDG